MVFCFLLGGREVQLPHHQKRTMIIMVLIPWSMGIGVFTDASPIPIGSQHVTCFILYAGTGEGEAVNPWGCALPRRPDVPKYLLV